MKSRQLLEPETFAESMRPIYAGVRLREVELLNPAGELEHRRHPCRVSGDWPLPREDLAP